MKKKITFILALLLGGIAMVTLSACSKYNNREWIENKVSEVSRVYPTENLLDLFKEFPKGFKVYQTYVQDDYIVDITLKGNSENSTISGTLVRTPTSDDSKEPDETVEVNYVNGQFVFSDEQKAKEIWKFGGFLFQKLTINKSFLSKLPLKSKSYNWNNGSFDINYYIQNRTINQYFKKSNDTKTVLEFGSSRRLDNLYYYSVILRYDDGYYFRETVSDLEGGQNE